MSSAGFPINDLLQKETSNKPNHHNFNLSVASTLFLLLFSSRLGFNATSGSGILTLGISGIFVNFTVFIGILIFVIGAVLTSLYRFLDDGSENTRFRFNQSCWMPKQPCCRILHDRTLNHNLCRLRFRHSFWFFDGFCVANLVFSGYNLPNFWFGALVFVAFFVLAMFFGLQAYP